MRWRLPGASGTFNNGSAYAAEGAFPLATPGASAGGYWSLMTSGSRCLSSVPVAECRHVG